MPQQSPVVINDGQATPVAHTFIPAGARQISAGKMAATWVEKTEKRAAWRVIREYHAEPNGAGLEKRRFVIEVPILEVVGATVAGFIPADRVAYTIQVDTTFILPVRASEAEIKDVVAFNANFFALTALKSMIQTRDPSW